MSHVPSFSLSFSGTYYYMPNGHDGFTPKQIKSVGLPGPDDDPAEWVKDQVTRHFDYWVEHNTKHPNNGSEMNEHYATGYHFLFPKEL